MMFPIILLNLLPGMLCQPFTLKQTLTGSPADVPLIAVSDGSECIIATSMGEKISAFKKTGEDFDPWEDWSYFNDDVQQVMPSLVLVDLLITGDGRQFIFSGDILEISSIAGGFYLHQLSRYDGIMINYTSSYPAGVLALTDDHIWVVAARQNGDLSVYRSEGSTDTNREKLD